MKLKTIYICSNCEYQNTKWSGQCPDCKEWNTLSEDVINIGKTDKVSLSSTPRKLKKAQPLSIDETEQEVFSSGISELDRVLGSGITAASITLMSGEPGIGKSTLTLQIASKLAETKKTLIISGEESTSQIAKRAKRLNLKYEKIFAINENSLENILQNLISEKPDFAIIDSIQVIASSDIPSSAGSVSQVRFCTERLLELAKNEGISILLIGHVTKDGNLAGPRVLEHLVDTVLLFEGDRLQNYRLLRAIKNRFGSCSEVGLFEMSEKGLSEVKNANAHLLAENHSNSIGTAITVALEGNRPFLIEVQALVSKTSFGYPKRTANGVDMSRLQILIAALEKYGGVSMQDQDIFINVVGGIKLSEPAADLAIVLAILSSFAQKPLPKSSVCFGEIGLSGEVRKVKQSEKRIKEANALGLTKIVSPKDFKNIQQMISYFKN